MDKLIDFPLDENIVPPNIDDNCENKVIGHITYNYTDNNKINALEQFLSLKRKNNSRFNLPDVTIDNTSILFSEKSDYYGNLKENLQELLSFIEIIKIKTVDVDILVINTSNYGELIHIKEKDGKIISAMGEIVFRKYC